MKSLINGSVINRAEKMDSIVAVNVANNGMMVEAHVSLIAPVHRPKCWRAEIVINGGRMFTSHHDFRSEAKKHAQEMQKVYLAVHSVRHV